MEATPNEKAGLLLTLARTFASRRCSFSLTSATNSFARHLCATDAPLARHWRVTGLNYSIFRFIFPRGWMTSRLPAYFAIFVVHRRSVSFATVRGEGECKRGRKRKNPAARWVGGREDEQASFIDWLGLLEAERDSGRDSFAWDNIIPYDAVLYLLDR